MRVYDGLIYVHIIQKKKKDDGINLILKQEVK
jgi:hypothetical protein